MHGSQLDTKLIAQYGAVSAEVADAMARGPLKVCLGVAGPEPGERGNPLGIVYLACARKAGSCVGVKREFGDIGRSRIRYKAASDALGLIARVAKLRPR